MSSLFLHILCPLCLGFLTYWGLRPEPILLMDAIGLPPLQLLSLASAPFWLRFWAYTLPDMCWLYALLAALYGVWSQGLFAGMHWLVLLGALASEFAQTMGWIAGTGDIWDMFGYASTWAIFYYLFKNKTNHVSKN